jgi:ATP-binding cassette subfamily B protein RaxB
VVIGTYLQFARADLIVNSHINITPSRSDQLLNFNGRRRLPVIVQTEMAECGLACLAMILGFYGFDTDLIGLRRRFSVSSHGMGLKNLMDMAARVHLAPRALRVDMVDLDKVQLPCILHWNMNHFVVLKSVKKNKFMLHDPAFGERILTAIEFSNQFTGVALELTPTQSFEKGDDKQTLTFKHFWSKMTGLKRSLTQIVLLSFLLQVFALVSPFYMQTVVDDVILRKDANLLIVLALGFGLLLIVQQFTTALREFVILHISSRLGMQMSANLFRHLIRLPMDYFARRHMGDVVSRFGSLNNVRSLLTTGLVAAIVDGVMALLTLVAMFFYDIKLTFIVLIVVAVYAFFRWALYRPFRMMNEESIIAAAKENSHFMESVRAIQTVKLFQRENDRQSQWQNHLANVMNKNIRISRWGIGYNTLNGFLFGIENLLVVYFAATAVMDSIISVGMFYAFMSYKGRFISSMDSLIAQWIEFKMLDLHFNRLADIAFTGSENIDEHVSDSFCVFHGNEGALKIEGRIEVQNLSYRFSDLEPYVFKNLSFTIEAGETVAITGPSGCGKSTLLKCLMGLIESTEGEILIDGNSLRNHKNYRSQIAAVMQDDQLISGDIAENIACFSPVVDMQKVNFCAQLACIHEDIMKMPMNYHTLVGDMGTSLSGGQKQRIILARALYREPRILFMDEATSHLDVTSESVVNHHIQQLPITRVMVAHRPETVASAGRQINLADHGDW